MKLLKRILLILLLAFVVIQFFRPKKNVSAQTSRNDIATLYAVPGDVKVILDKACNDCHSNNTRYPWYAKLQPIHWWLDKHVREGKGHINYDEYTNRPLRYQYHKMEEVIEMIEDGKMPLKTYTWTHKDARLAADEQSKIIGWANSIMDTMKAQYPIDSLIRKK